MPKLSSLLVRDNEPGSMTLWLQQARRRCMTELPFMPSVTRCDQTVILLRQDKANSSAREDTTPVETGTGNVSIDF